MQCKKHPYSFLSNMKYVFHAIWHVQKKLTVGIFLRAPFLVFIPFLGICLSKEVVRGVAAGDTVQELIAAIAVLSLALVICLVCEKYLTAALNGFLMKTDMYWQFQLFDKTVSMDYENIDNPDGLTKLAKAMEQCGTDQCGTRIVARVISSSVSNLLGAAVYAVLLSALNPWIMLVVAVTTVLGFFLLKLTGKWNYRNRDNWKGYDRKISYLKANSGDFGNAKDMRLYRMSRWFMDAFAETLEGRMAWSWKEQMYGLKVDFGMTALAFLREGFTYGFLVLLIFGNGMSADEFVLYFGLIGGFAAWLSGLTHDMEDLNRVHLGICEIREYMDIPDRQNHGEGALLPQETFSIEFRNVSYRYDKSEADALHDVSFQIRKGEKIAIVGPNGAGKTTLIKLMCGLYVPAEGVILIDGRPVSDYNITELYSLFSVVFQEIYVFPFSIARNVSASTQEKTDMDRAENALRLAGLYDKVSSLPQGMQTVVGKSVHEDAVEFSGGELQKLALARALYKDGKALILDEPTAALDPIAESRIYNEYNKMAQDHTSVFISHRLASTQFCDRIFFLEQGKIVEEGSHTELLKKGGKYRYMYDVQSRYYREEACEHEAEG